MPPQTRGVPLKAVHALAAVNCCETQSYGLAVHVHGFWVWGKLKLLLPRPLLFYQNAFELILKLTFTSNPPTNQLPKSSFLSPKTNLKGQNLLSFCHEQENDHVKRQYGFSQDRTPPTIPYTSFFKTKIW